MIKEFPFFKKEYILRRFEVKEGTKIAIYGIYNKKRIELNEDALFIVKHLTGWHSVEEIANKISSKYQIGYDKAFESLNKILSQLKSKEIISFNENREVKYEFSNLPQMRGVLNHVYILLTNACNFRCPHCSVNAGKKLKEELKKEEIFYIVDQIYEMMVPGVTFTGGEPTLVDYLPELIKYTASKPIKTHLMTNGYKIDREYAELLVRNGLVHVNISLDGAKEETHDTFRKTKGAFKRAIEAIKIFI